MFINTHPATTLIVKSATLAQVQSEDKTCDRMAKDDIGIWWEGRGGAGGGGGIGGGRGGGGGRWGGGGGQLLLFTF